MILDYLLSGYLPVSHPANWGCAVFFRRIQLSDSMERYPDAVYAWGVELFDPADRTPDPVIAYLAYCARFHHLLVSLVKGENND